MRRVLVVEDEDMQRTSFVRALSKLEDCGVVGVATVGAALEAIDAQAPDVIVSDIGLPDRLGVELMGELASRALHPAVLFVTADVHAHRHHLPEGVSVLEKPVALATLRQTISRLLAPSTEHAGGGDAPRLTA